MIISATDSPRASKPQKREFTLQCFLMSRSTLFFPFSPLLHLYCCLSFYCFFSIMQVPSHICDFSALWDDFHIFKGTYWTLAQTRSKRNNKPASLISHLKLSLKCTIQNYIKCIKHASFDISLKSLCVHKCLCMNVFMSQVRSFDYCWICLFLSFFSQKARITENMQYLKNNSVFYNETWKVFTFQTD